MDRRQLIKKAGLAMAAFSLSRDLFANEVFHTSTSRQQEIIKLSANENPYGPSPLAIKAMTTAITASNRYHWDKTATIKEAISKLTNHTAANVAIGAGSSELLGLITAWASMKKGNIIAPTPTFTIWMGAAKGLEMEVVTIPLDNKKNTDLKAMKAAINAATRMVYICNPNNPTGVPIPTTELTAFIKEVAPTTIVLLDEAYTEFEDTPSMSHLINNYPNLIIAKTFSKIYGMAGCRVGYALAHEETIKKISALQAWADASASSIAIEGALAVLKDSSFVNYCKTENAKCRKILFDALEKAGLPYLPSVTSFVYFDTAGYKKDVAALMEENNIVGVRTFEKDSTWRRLSIGTQAEMEKVAAILLQHK